MTGERDARSEDRQLLLDAVLAAQEHARRHLHRRQRSTARSGRPRCRSASSSTPSSAPRPVRGGRRARAPPAAAVRRAELRRGTTATPFSFDRPRRRGGACPAARAPSPLRRSWPRRWPDPRPATSPSPTCRPSRAPGRAGSCAGGSTSRVPEEYDEVNDALPVEIDAARGLAARRPCPARHHRRGRPAGHPAWPSSSAATCRPAARRAPAARRRPRGAGQLWRRPARLRDLGRRPSTSPSTWAAGGGSPASWPTCVAAASCGSTTPSSLRQAPARGLGRPARAVRRATRPVVDGPHRRMVQSTAARASPGRSVRSSPTPRRPAALARRRPRPRAARAAAALREDPAAWADRFRKDGQGEVDADRAWRSSDRSPVSTRTPRTCACTGRRPRWTGSRACRRTTSAGTTDERTRLGQYALRIWDSAARSTSGDGTCERPGRVRHRRRAARARHDHAARGECGHRQDMGDRGAGRPLRARGGHAARRAARRHLRARREPGAAVRGCASGSSGPSERSRPPSPGRPPTRRRRPAGAAAPRLPGGAAAAPRPGAERAHRLRRRDDRDHPPVLPARAAQPRRRRRQRRAAPSSSRTSTTCRSEVVDDLYVAEFASDAAPALDLTAAGDLAARVVGDPRAVLRPDDGGTDDLADVRVRFAQAVRAQMEVRKRRLGILGYDDLLSRLADVLEDADASARTRMRDRWRVVLVDEFQDTDPVQWQVLRPGVHAGTPRWSSSATRSRRSTPSAAATSSPTPRPATPPPTTPPSRQPPQRRASRRRRSRPCCAVPRLGDGIVVRDVAPTSGSGRLARGAAARHRSGCAWCTGRRSAARGRRGSVTSARSSPRTSRRTSRACSRRRRPSTASRCRPRTSRSCARRPPSATSSTRPSTSVGVPSVVLRAQSVFASAGGRRLGLRCSRRWSSRTAAAGCGPPRSPAFLGRTAAGAGRGRRAHPAPRRDGCVTGP